MHEKNFREKKKDYMVSVAKIIHVKISSWVKTNKSLKLLLVYMKANGSILMRLGMAGMVQSK